MRRIEQRHRTARAEATGCRWPLAAAALLLLTGLGGGCVRSRLSGLAEKLGSRQLRCAKAAVTVAHEGSCRSRGSTQLHVYRVSGCGRTARMMCVHRSGGHKDYGRSTGSYDVYVSWRNARCDLFQSRYRTLRLPADGHGEGARTALDKYLALHAQESLAIQRGARRYAGLFLSGVAAIVVERAAHGWAGDQDASAIRLMTAIVRLPPVPPPWKDRKLKGKWLLRQNAMEALRTAVRARAYRIPLALEQALREAGEAVSDAKDKIARTVDLRYDWGPHCFAK